MCLFTRYVNYYTKIFTFFFFTWNKNEWKECEFWRQKINKSNFYKSKKLFKIDDIDVNKILVSKKELYSKKSSFKHVIGYNDNDDLIPLCIKLSQMIGYAKYFDSNKAMSFKVSDKKLLKTYTTIWKKISSLIGKDFDKYKFSR